MNYPFNMLARSQLPTCVYFPMSRRELPRLVGKHKLNCMTSMSRSVARVYEKNTHTRAHLSCVKACVYAPRSSRRRRRRRHESGCALHVTTPHDVHFHATRWLSLKNTHTHIRLLAISLSLSLRIFYSDAKVQKLFSRCLHD